MKLKFTSFVEKHIICRGDQYVEEGFISGACSS